MFIDFFYLLRKKGIPVSITEWMSFIEALYNGYFQTSLNHLYYIGRAFLVKSEAYYDMYDLAFQEFFGGIKTEQLELDKVLDWLENPLNRLPKLTPEEMADFQKQIEEFRKTHDMDELMKQFRERLKEQNERHDGGKNGSVQVAHPHSEHMVTIREAFGLAVNHGCSLLQRWQVSEGSRITEMILSLM
jgi:uncharacterized protein with von Willebrand factor type A (vWA) domain